MIEYMPLRDLQSMKELGKKQICTFLYISYIFKMKSCRSVIRYLWTTSIAYYLRRTEDRSL